MVRKEEAVPAPPFECAANQPVRRSKECAHTKNATNVTKRCVSSEEEGEEEIDEEEEEEEEEAEEEEK